MHNKGKHGPFQSAPELARAGYSVFPVAPNQKKPSVEGGFYAATTDANQIARWLEEGRENHNIGMATGVLSGVVVVEADTPERNAEMEAKYGPPTVRTTRGGHWYFSHPRDGKVISHNIKNSLDRKGDGGYVVAPPSRGRMWTTAGIPDKAALPPLPPELRGVKKPVREDPDPAEKAGHLDPETRRRAIEHIAAHVRMIEQGQRHEHLLHLSGVLLTLGLGMEDAEAILVDAWSTVGGDLAERAPEEVPNALNTTAAALAEGNATGVPSMEKITPGLFADLSRVFRWSAPASERISDNGRGPKKAIGAPPKDTGAFKAGEENAGDESPRSRGMFKAFKALNRVPKDLPGVAEIPTSALPAGCRQLVREASEAIGCPADFLAVPMLAALGSAIGLSHVIEVIEGWTEAPNLWVATVGHPGSRKTPPAREAKRPVAGYQAKLLQEYREELREYQSQEGEDREDPPVKQTCFVDDITNEALVVTLGESPRGVIQFKDELLGLIRGLDQYKGGKGSDRQFYLSCWSGESYSYKRKGSKEDILLLRPFLSVVGSIQTDLLQEISDRREDGLVDRFLFSFPNPVQSWLTESKGISEQARKSYASLYMRLRELKPASVDEFGTPEPRIVKPAPEAKTLLRDRINGLRLEAQLPGFPSRLTWVWPKLEAYLARLTLILAMCRCVDLWAAGQKVTPRIEKDDVDRGFEILNYFKSHARRVYGLLYEYAPRERLLEDVGRFILLQEGSWRGTPTELHEQLESDYKPERAAELSKFLKHRAETRGDILYATKIERVVLEDGRETTRNVATLEAPYLGISLNALSALNIGLEMGST